MHSTFMCATDALVNDPQYGGGTTPFSPLFCRTFSQHYKKKQFSLCRWVTRSGIESDDLFMVESTSITGEGARPLQVGL